MITTVVLALVINVCISAVGSWFFYHQPRRITLRDSIPLFLLFLLVTALLVVGKDNFWLLVAGMLLLVPIFGGILLVLGWILGLLYPESRNGLGRSNALVGGLIVTGFIEGLAGAPLSWFAGASLFVAFFFPH